MSLSLSQRATKFARTLFRRPSKVVALIEDALWQRATRHYVFVQALTTEENRRLRLIASEFLSHKTFIGAANQVIDDLLRVQIAAQASILVLELGVQNFSDWSKIIIYPSQFIPKREIMDEAGVVHTTRQVLSGEAWLGGPVVLSHEDVARAENASGEPSGSNVVIHEFAHKLDMLNGEPNGFPPLHKGMDKEQWKRAFLEGYLQFCEATDRADAMALRDGGEALDALPLDPYAAESPAEFFAVLSEAFFETPQVVRGAFPTIYVQLSAFYRQDPASRPYPTVNT